MSLGYFLQCCSTTTSNHDKFIHFMMRRPCYS